MLASVLPGFRELRAPLVAGLLWLFALWLVIDLPTREAVEKEDGVWSDVLELAEALGRPGLIAVSLFAAYLIGSLSEMARLWVLGRRRLRRWAETLRRRNENRGEAGLSRRGAASLTQYLDGALRPVAAAAHAKGYDDVRTALGRPAEHPIADEIHVADWETLIPDVADEVLRELPIIRTRLVSEHPEHASEYDRLTAEGELRLAIAGPLTVVISLVALRDGPLWILGLLFVLALVVQGVRRVEQAGDVVVDALLAGITSAPAIDRLSSQVEAASPAGEHGTVQPSSERS